MSTHRIALLKGDGVGPEVCGAAMLVLESLEKQGFSFDVRQVEAGDECLKLTGVALPKETMATIRDCDTCFKGPVGASAADVIVRLRQTLDLYANIRPVASLPGVACLSRDVDFVIVRENTEDLYKGLEFEVPDGAVAMRLITRKASERIARHAFRLAERRAKLRRVVAVHKANVLRKTEAVFMNACASVSKEFPNVELSQMLVDAAAMNIVRDPQSFDVLVTTNMFGDILSDEAAQLVGGLGLAPSANIGDEYAIFEPVHGSAPDIAGKGIANPVASILTLSMMFDWLAESRKEVKCKEAAGKIREAVNTVLLKGIVTPDLGGAYTTVQVGKAVAEELTRLLKTVF
jgi:3-isopropylmalate dehydrogenase